MKYIMSFSIALCIMIMLSSCATIFSGSHDKITIDSEPQGAEIYFEGQNLGTTPQEVSIKRRFSYLNDGRVPIKLVHPGYKPMGYGAGYGVDASFNIVSAFNLLLLPLGIDALTGSITNYPEYATFVLVPEDKE